MSYETSCAELLAPMADAAVEVGELLLKTPRPAPAATFEAFRSLFLELEAPLIAALRPRLDAVRPGVAWADEMDAVLPERGEVWVVDAIDGAVQFMRDMPQYCVSVTLVRDREPVAAVLHCPPLGETYQAAAGHGATRNGVPIGPSGEREPAAAVVGSSHPPFVGEQPGAAEAWGRSLAAVAPAVAAVRNLGPTSWQIADAAAGRLDAFWQFGRDDGNLLPGALLAREAGALVTDAEGRPWRAGAASFLAAPPALHGRLLSLLAQPSRTGISW
ncbi:inositol monophosphatase family protein [Streptomyces melanogenes]|uniref:inositol monophosphatase family protein n=1 Tax=Streptomyces melanogenes TaxID=67326 RepID=UPI003787E4B8